MAKTEKLYSISVDSYSGEFVTLKDGQPYNLGSVHVKDTGSKITNISPFTLKSDFKNGLAQVDFRTTRMDDQNPFTNHEVYITRSGHQLNKNEHAELIEIVTEIYKDPELLNRLQFDKVAELGDPRFCYDILMDIAQHSVEESARKIKEPSKLDELFKKVKKLVENFNAKVKTTVLDATAKKTPNKGLGG